MKHDMRRLRESFRQAARLRWRQAIQEPEKIVEIFLEEDRELVVRGLAHMLGEEVDALVLDDLLEKQMEGAEREKCTEQYEQLQRISEEVKLPLWFILRLGGERRSQFIDAAMFILELRKEELKARIQENLRRPYAPTPPTLEEAERAVDEVIRSVGRHVKN